MDVWMYVYMYGCLYTCIYAYVHKFIRINSAVYYFIFPIYMFVYMSICIYVYLHMYICMLKRICVCLYVLCMFICAYVCVHLYMYRRYVDICMMHLTRLVLEKTNLLRFHCLSGCMRGGRQVIRESTCRLSAAAPVRQRKCLLRCPGTCNSRS